MRALAISDTHFGAWTGDDLLSREFALEALAPHLDDIDEFVLLGDLFDLLFSTVDHAFAQADPFFSLVREKMQGKRVVWLAGNHDHHIVVRELRSAVELKIASGAMGPELSELFRAEHRGFFHRFLERRLDGVQTEVVYPYHRVGRALLFHGHYLDAHMRGSLADRLLTRSIWTIAGGRPSEMLSVEDYESAIVPLTELLFTVAQLPRGTTAQRAFHAHLQGIGQVLSLVGAARGGLRHLRHWHRSGRSLTRPCSPTGSVPLQLAAYGQVVRNLGWDQLTDTMVFAHTHQPLDGVQDDGDRRLRFWNTGSWIYEAPRGNGDAYRRYLERAWPGTAVLIDTDAPAPVLVEMLADRNPLRRGQ